MPEFTLRDATLADIPHVLRLVRGLADYEKLLHQAVGTEDDFRLALFGPQPRAYAVLAEVPNKPPVGMALWFYMFSTFSGRCDMYLEDLFVEPDHRGTGIGLGLLRHLARIAVKERCRFIEWKVLNWNKPSIDFYIRLGATELDDWHVRQLGGAALAALAEGEPAHG